MINSGNLCLPQTKSSPLHHRIQDILRYQFNNKSRVSEHYSRIFYEMQIFFLRSRFYEQTKYSHFFQSGGWRWHYDGPSAYILLGLGRQTVRLNVDVVLADCWTPNRPSAHCLCPVRGCCSDALSHLWPNAAKYIGWWNDGVSMTKLGWNYYLSTNLTPFQTTIRPTGTMRQKEWLWVTFFR